MDKCDLWLLTEAINYATLFYWMCFLSVWIHRVLTLPVPPCGQLHLAVAGTVVSRLISKSLSIPSLFVCNPHVGLRALSYLSQSFTLAVILTLGLLICRGYGITHWSVGRRTAVGAAAASAGIFIAAAISVATEGTLFQSVEFGYYLLVYTYQLYLGLRTLRTIAAIERFVSHRQEAAQRKPVLEKERLMAVIIAILIAVYLFQLCFFAFSIVDLVLGEAIMAHITEIRDIVLVLMEPVVNTVVYYQVRPKPEDYDLAYTVDEKEPFRFEPETGTMIRLWQGD